MVICTTHVEHILISSPCQKECVRKHSGSVVECLTRDLEVASSSLTGVTALWSCKRHMNPCLVLVQPRKIRPDITEKLLTRHKESNKQRRNVWKQGIGLCH